MQFYLARGNGAIYSLLEIKRKLVCLVKIICLELTLVNKRQISIAVCV